MRVLGIWLIGGGGGGWAWWAWEQGEAHHARNRAFVVVVVAGARKWLPPPEIEHGRSILGGVVVGARAWRLPPPKDCHRPKSSVRARFRAVVVEEGGWWKKTASPCIWSKGGESVEEKQPPPARASRAREGWRGGGRRGSALHLGFRARERWVEKKWPPCVWSEGGVWEKRPSVLRFEGVRGMAVVGRKRPPLSRVSSETEEGGGG